MITTKTITIGEQSITCRELTVGQIDQAIGEIAPGGAMHRHYTIMGYEVTPEFVATSSGYTAEQQAALDVDELDSLVATVQEVNARFLSRIGRPAAKSAVTDDPACAAPSVPA